VNCQFTSLATTLRKPSSDPATLGSLAITREYLATNPDEPSLKHRINAIKSLIKKELGRKQKEADLKEWFKTVNHLGLKADRATCTNPQVLVQQVYANNFFYGGNRKVVLVVRADKRGYHLDSR
jgi:hypothetical protein